MIKSEKINLIKGFGIEDDLNANQISPRQILITRKEDLDELNIPYGGLRENIILKGVSEKDFVPGAVLSLGQTVKIRLTFYCEPCKRIIDVVPNLKVIINKRGVLGVIIEGGKIEIGDNVSLRVGQFEAFSEIPYERFLNFIKLVPLGKVITYKMITIGIGVAESYIRAIPKYIEKGLSENENLPLHRIVDTTGSIITNYIPNQKELLEKEKVTIISEYNLFDDHKKYKVPLRKYLWLGSQLYLN